MSESAPVGVTPDLVTSPIFRIRGQQSRWRYPDQRLSPEQCEKLRNVNLSEFGTADSRMGYKKYSQTTLPSSEAVVGLHQATWTTATNQLVVTPTKIYIDTGPARTDVTGTITLTAGGADDRYRFAFLRDQVIATNGKDEIWVKNNDVDASPGNATALSFNASGVTVNACDDVISHKGLLLFMAPTEGATKYPTRIRWSDIDSRTFIPDITKWPDANRYELYEGGSKIIGGCDNWGMVLVFKADGLYPCHIEYEVGFLELRPDTPRRGFHPLAKNSIVCRPDFVACICQEGLVIIRPDLSHQLATIGMMDEWLGLNQGRLQYAHGWIRERDHQVRFLLSSAGNTTSHDVILVWDWETGDTWIDEPTDVLNFAGRVVLSDKELDWFGGAAGVVWQSDHVTKDDDGTGFAWEIQMAPNDLGHPGRTKNIINLKTIYRGRSGQQTAVLDVFRNQGKLETRTKTVSFQTDALAWNSGEVWDTGGRWQTGRNEDDTFFVNRHAELIGPRWKGNDPATLIGYQVQFSVVE